MGRKQIQAQQGGMKSRVECRRPGVRILCGGEGSASPSQSSASFVELLGRSVGRDGNAGIREELLLLWLVRDIDLGLGGSSEFGESRGRRRHGGGMSGSSVLWREERLADVVVDKVVAEVIDKESVQ
jgi:hypothetical protein